MVIKRSLILGLLVCFAVVSPCLAQQGGDKIGPDIKALVEQQDKAFNAQDINGIMATYSSGPEIVVMGTGPGETYLGKQGIESAYSQFFNSFKAGELTTTYDWVSTSSKGDVAWFAVTKTLSKMVNKEKKERSLNLSGTATKENGQWRFVTLHFSRLGAMDQTAQPQPKK
ncbi:MAG: nuclear transport factor 2 family protein [Deltaproteobacteria bacterium]|nr:nuclear transport factor 2 family protein [Deltaproteobacteria bacterium]